MAVDLCRDGNRRVAKLFTHQFDISAAFQQVGSIGVAQGVEGTMAEGLLTPPIEIPDIIRCDTSPVVMAADETGFFIVGAILEAVLIH